MAVEESPDDLVATGDSLGMDLSRAVKDGLLRVTDASRPMEGPMVVSGEYDISGLIHRVEAIVKQTGAKAVVVDSATALFSPRPPQELLRSLFFQLIHALRRMRPHLGGPGRVRRRTTGSSPRWASRTTSATW